MRPENQLFMSLASAKTVEVDSAERVAVLRKLKIDEMFQVLDQVQKSVIESLSASQRQAFDLHNARTNLHPCNHTVKGYVVFAQARGPPPEMSCTWVGPRQISHILSDFTVKVGHLPVNDEEILQVSRDMPYDDSSVVSPVQIHDIADFNDRVWFAVHKIIHVRKT